MCAEKKNIKISSRGGYLEQLFEMSNPNPNCAFTEKFQLIFLIITTIVYCIFFFRFFMQLFILLSLHSFVTMQLFILLPLCNFV